MNLQGCSLFCDAGKTAFRGDGTTIFTKYSTEFEQIRINIVPIETYFEFCVCKWGYFICWEKNAI